MAAALKAEAMKVLKVMASTRDKAVQEIQDTRDKASREARANKVLMVMKEEITKVDLLTVQVQETTVAEARVETTVVVTTVAVQDKVTTVAVLTDHKVVMDSKAVTVVDKVDLLTVQVQETTVAEARVVTGAVQDKVTTVAGLTDHKVVTDKEARVVLLTDKVLETTVAEPRVVTGAVQDKVTTVAGLTKAIAAEKVMDVALTVGMTVKAMAERAVVNNKDGTVKTGITATGN